VNRSEKIRILRKELAKGERSGVSKRTIEEIWKRVKLLHK